MKDFTVNGVWWLPQGPTARVAGSLQVSSDKGLQLSLFGPLGEESTLPGMKHAPIILGSVWDAPSPLGQDVTLTGSWTKGVSFGSIGLTREEYHVERAFIGSHLEQEGLLSFSYLRISLSGLASWASGYTGLSYQHIPKTADHRAGFEIRWTSPEPIRGHVPGGALVLGIGASMPMQTRDYSIKERIGISIDLEQPQGADALNGKYVYPLLNFLTLATDQPNSMVELAVRRPASQEDIYLFGARVFDDAAAAENLTRHKMIFSLDEVRDRAVAMIGRWIELSERLSRVCNVYFGSLYQPHAFVEVRLIAVLQALEVYERALPTSVCKGEPPGGRLREQFTRLVEDHRQVVGPLFGKDLANSVADLLDYRNEVVHGTTGLAKRPEYGERLLWWTYRLRFLMTACFLTELGLPDTEQVGFFHQNAMFIHVAGLTVDPGAS